MNINDMQGIFKDNLGRRNLKNRLHSSSASIFSNKEQHSPFNKRKREQKKMEDTGEGKSQRVRRIES